MGAIFQVANCILKPINSRGLCKYNDLCYTHGLIGYEIRHLSQTNFS